MYSPKVYKIVQGFRILEMMYVACFMVQRATPTQTLIVKSLILNELVRSFLREIFLLDGIPFLCIHVLYKEYIRTYRNTQHSRVSYNDYTLPIVTKCCCLYSALPLCLCRYNWNVTACALVVFHDFLDHLDGIVAKVQRKVFGPVDDPVLGGYLDAVCDKVGWVERDDIHTYVCAYCVYVLYMQCVYILCTYTYVFCSYSTYVHNIMSCILCVCTYIYVV